MNSTFARVVYGAIEASVKKAGRWSVFGIDLNIAYCLGHLLISDLTRHGSDEDYAALLTVLQHDSGTSLSDNVGAGDVDLEDTTDVLMIIVQCWYFLLDCLRVCALSQNAFKQEETLETILAAQCTSTRRGAGAS